jgi:hypothetical protein
VGAISQVFTGTATSAALRFVSSSAGSLAFIGDGVTAIGAFGSLSVGMVGDFIGVGVSALSPFAASGIAAGGTVYRTVTITAFTPHATPTSTVAAGEALTPTSWIT